MGSHFAWGLTTLSLCFVLVIILGGCAKQTALLAEHAAIESALGMPAPPVRPRPWGDCIVIRPSQFPEIC